MMMMIEKIQANVSIANFKRGRHFFPDSFYLSSCALITKVFNFFFIEVKRALERGELEKDVE